jgi:galactokinase
MLIDCQSGELQQITFASDRVILLLVDSGIRHSLAGGEYANRRQQCSEALQSMGKSSFRHVTFADLDGHRRTMNDLLWRRARHVVSEIARVQRAAESLARESWAELGLLMNDSHRSMRDDFEISCPEIDQLVEIALKIGAAGGVLGSRMTGGGFGGCVVNLVEKRDVQRVARTIRAAYRSATGIDADCFLIRPGRGAHVIEAP